MVPLPLAARSISRVENPHIMMGKSPERDREIDDICQMIRNIAQKAGIPAVKYNMSILGVVRTDRHARPRRRDVQHVRLRQGEARTADRRSRAAERRSLLGAHHLFPQARGARRRGMQGAPMLSSARSRHAARQGLPRRRAVLGSVEGLKRFVGIMPSKYHGLNFCQGTVSEMLEKPGEQIFDVIR